MKVEIDSREKSRINTAVEYFKKKGLECEIKQLNSNDYVFTDGIKTVGFEFKEIDDFVTSIGNGKIFRQIAESDTDFTFVVVQGFNDLSSALFKYNYFSNNKLYDVTAAIARLNLLCDGVWVVESVVFQKSLNNMFVQADKCFNLKEYTKMGDLKKVDDPVVNYLNSIKGVNLKTSKLICGELKLNSLKDLLKVSKDDLISIKGIGENKSELILKAIKED